MESLLVFGVPGLFLAATILPFSSEILLILLIRQSGAWLLPFAEATTGNILGSVVNYYLGLYGNRFLFYKMFRLKENTVRKQPPASGNTGCTVCSLPGFPLLAIR